MPENDTQRRVIWKPQPKQQLFMERGEFEALYGGAAGGGKSEALVIEALRQVDIPHYKCLILRKTYPELSELIDKSLKYYPALYPTARYNGSTHTWRFPSGAKIVFGAMQYDKDKTKYQGLAFDVIMFDELTHFTYDEYIYLFSRCRPNGEGTQCYIRATGNPGGVGHAWVKERFITAAPPMTTIWTTNEWVDNNGKQHKARQSRVFVPSSVFDNPELLKNDPLYVQRLASMPEAERNALLYGNWDTFSGQVFTEWRNDSSHYEDRINTHVISPFRIPTDWNIYCGMDWGYSRPFAVSWYCTDPAGRLYNIRELYGCTGTPNQGVKWEPAEVARAIKRIEEEDPNLKGRRIRRIGDPAIWGSDGTESIGALFERERVYFEKGDHARIDGKMQIHHRLAFDEDGMPMLYVFNTCANMIRTLPALVYDTKDVEDIDTDGEDHCLIGNTLVWTEAGKRPISELVGTTGRVLSSDGRYHAYSDVRKTQTNAEVFTVELEDGSTVTATANHRFKLANGEWRRLDELNEGSELWKMPGKTTVKAIRPAGTADVFNMEVDGTHDFAVNGGVIVHNCYDQLRYICMANPIAAPVRKQPVIKQYNPLDTDDTNARHDPYAWYKIY